MMRLFQKVDTRFSAIFRGSPSGARTGGVSIDFIHQQHTHGAGGKLLGSEFAPTRARYPPGNFLLRMVFPEVRDFRFPHPFPKNRGALYGGGKPLFGKGFRKILRGPCPKYGAGIHGNEIAEDIHFEFRFPHLGRRHNGYSPQPGIHSTIHKLPLKGCPAGFPSARLRSVFAG